MLWLLLFLDFLNCGILHSEAVLLGLFLYFPPGRLLDATHQYMHVFLLAGCEVTLSAFVITLGNFFCIRKKQEDPEVNMEMAVTASEMERLNRADEGQEADKGEMPGGKENGTVDAVMPGEVVMMKEKGEEGGDENKML